MESSTLALLTDGTGWATWENAAGGCERVLLAWTRSETDAFSITELRLISGAWRSEHPNKIFYTEPPSILANVTWLRYELVQETPPLGTELMPVLKLDRPFMFNRAYALNRRSITQVDRPVAIEDRSHEHD